MPDDPLTPEQDVPLNPVLAPHQGAPIPEETLITETLEQQGPPPADFASRPAVATLATGEEPLSAAAVAALTGSAEQLTQTNRTLEQAEGLDPDRSES